jgi:hypothetical protein
VEIDERAYSRLVLEQDSVLTYAQLLSCGWNYDAIEHRIGRKDWQILVTGVVLITSGVPTARQRLRGGLLHGGDGAALTSLAACQLYELKAIPESEFVHVAVAAKKAPRSNRFVRILPTTRPFLSIDRDGLGVVGAPRAVVDACLQMRVLNDVRALVAEAVQRRRASTDSLQREMGSAPVRGSRLLRMALAEVLGGARSAPEGVLLGALQARADLPPYEMNANVYDDNGRWLACSDVVFRAQRVLVEVDGAAWHLSPERWAADIERHTRLEAAGWTVLRYPASRVFTDASGVAADIADCLRRRSQAS